jgi:hypothetical protein
MAALERRLENVENGRSPREPAGDEAELAER